jgi:glycosyltransferase involved in cell wall biosynthesis
MKICIVGPGYKPIPPDGWGAVESVIWDYYINLKSEHDITIINNKDLNQVIHQVNAVDYDLVHIMYDDHVIITPYLKCTKIFYTSHYAYITHPTFETSQSWYFHNVFKHALLNKERIYLNVISSSIKDIYVKYGFPSNRINILHNGAREDAFLYHAQPLYANKSIYLAKIEERKKQWVYQRLNNIDFVGNYHNSNFDITKPHYLGEWTKDILYKNLTNYANLILLSDGEADPLVVKEALICGLGVVISECASANLDLTKDFITVIPNDKLLDLNYVDNEISKNRLISVKKRDEIREYGLKYFSWKSIIQTYNKLIRK